MNIEDAFPAEEQFEKGKNRSTDESKSRNVPD